YTVKLVDEDGNAITVPTGESVTVDVAWSGAAANATDASPLPTTVTISNGSQTTFVVDAIDDLYKEDPEALLATISNVVDVDGNFEAVAVGEEDTANATITDEQENGPDDTVYAVISIDKDTVAEGGELTYTVKLVDEDGNAITVPTGESVTVDVAWSGAAANATDASPLPTTVTISNGSQTTFVVDAIDDLYKEDPEALLATISNVVDVDGNFEAVAVGTENTANATITDESEPGTDDTVYAVISVNKDTVAEGGELTYTVKLVDEDGNAITVPTGESVTVDVAWSGAAANATDASPLPTTVTISNGSQMTFVVDAIDDLYKEDPEALLATISNVVDVDGNFEAVAVGVEDTANATITDEGTDDTVYAVISVNKDTVEEGGKLTYTVKLVDEDGNPVTVPTGESVTVDVAWSGAAANATDASPLPTTVTISNGSQMTFVVDAIDDLYKEDPEALLATISNVVDVDGNFEAVAVGEENTANATITDESTPGTDDTVYAVISVNKETVEEGGKLT
ncbi:MAG: hypothetical protein MJK10_22510, partial [Pseudomonadales bacterium]|nr:hypothetical protein [Pseudomonadales bacterium]